MVYVVFEEGNARSKTAKRGNFLNPRTRLGRALKIDCDLPDPCNNHMHRFSQTNGMKQVGRTITFSQHRVKVIGVSSRSLIANRYSTKPHQSFAQLPTLEGAETEVNLSHDEESVTALSKATISVMCPRTLT